MASRPAVPDPLAGTLATRYTGVVLDIDGCLIRGHTPVPGAAAVLAALREHGLGPVLATNNASRAPDEVAAWLTQAGLPVEVDQVVTSVHAAAALLSHDETVLVQGTRALREGLEARGVRTTDAWRDADVVVAGFNPELRYAQLRDSALAIQHGARFLATNVDTTIPAEDGLWPANGALCAALSTTTGVQPEVAGKPNRGLIDEATARLPDPTRRPLVVGDRLDTDIAAGTAAGCDTALVLTGAADAASPRPGDPTPTWVLDDVGGLLRPPPHG